MPSTHRLARSSVASPLPSSCFFVPPYVLEALARSGDGALEERARATLAHDEALRAERHSTQTLLPASAARPERRSEVVPQRAPEPTHSTLDGGPVRRIHDCQGRQDLPGTLVRSEGQAPTADETVDQAHDGLGATWELWATAYDRNSLDDKGLPLIASVHYGKGYDNAFWNGSQMVFGDGDGEIFLPFTRSLDVIGHELAHGVTQYTSGLNYEGQSGALNESISDVFGVLVKQRALGQSVEQADWLIGADLLAPGVQGRALRDMAAPGTAYDDPRLGKDPQPAHMDDFVVTSADNGGVHINSGIPNRAFVLAARAIGGKAWEETGAMWYAAVTGDIKADCDFATFARLTHEAAIEEFGAASSQAKAVAAAWQTVGVAPAPVPPKKKIARRSSPRGTSGPALPNDPSSPSGPAPDPAPDPPSAPDPAPDSSPGPTTGTRVSVIRTGGVAGLTKERSVTLKDLPTKDTKAWQGLLTEPAELRALAAETTHPDGFTYAIRCDRPRVEVMIPEPALPDHVRALLERTLEA